MGVFIRSFQLDDAEMCGAIVAATPLWERYGLTAPAASEQLRHAHARGELILIAEVQQRVAGFAWVVPEGAFGRCPYLRRIAVATEYRGQRVGAHLMHAIEQSARATASDLFLLVSDFNTEAQRFYEREGYEQVGRIPDFVVPGVAELLFRKRLPSS